MGIYILLAGLLSHLTLTDIAHGEPDVAGEWAIVKVLHIFGPFFILITLLTIWRFEQLYGGKTDGQYC